MNRHALRVSLAPGYRHAHATTAPHSRLNSGSDEAYSTYRKLSPFLAIRTDPLFPALGWSEAYARDLFERGGSHYPVRWMPHVREGFGWRRLTYGEFCVWYGLEPEAVLGSAEVACA